MYRTSNIYAIEKMKESGRTFRAKFSSPGLADMTEGIVSIKKTERCVPNDTLYVGGAYSAYIECKIWNPSIPIVEGQELQLSIGILIDDDIDWVPCGVYYCEKPYIKDGLYTFTAFGCIRRKLTNKYDGEIALPASSVAILEEISEITGVDIDIEQLDPDIMIEPVYEYSTIEEGENGEDTTVLHYKNPLAEYTYAEIIGYVAMRNGFFALEGRTGGIAFKWFEEIRQETIYYVDSFMSFLKVKDAFMVIPGSGKEYEIGTNRTYDDLEKNGEEISVETIVCDTGETELKAGTGANRVSLVNPFMKNQELANILEKISDISYTPVSCSFLGDHMIELCDVIRIADKDGSVYKVPVLENILTFDGGLKNEVYAYPTEEQEVETDGPVQSLLKKNQDEIRKRATKEEAENAAKTATSAIEFTEEGLVIGNKRNGEFQGARAVLDANSLDIRDGNNESIAKYGARARIGKEGSSRFEVDPEKIAAYNSDNAKYFELNEDGGKIGPMNITIADGGSRGQMKVLVMNPDMRDRPIIALAQYGMYMFPPDGSGGYNTQALPFRPMTTKTVTVFTGKTIAAGKYVSGTVRVSTKASGGIEMDPIGIIGYSTSGTRYGFCNIAKLVLTKSGIVYGIRNLGGNNATVTLSATLLMSVPLPYDPIVLPDDEGGDDDPEEAEPTVLMDF